MMLSQQNQNVFVPIGPNPRARVHRLIRGVVLAGLISLVAWSCLASSLVPAALAQDEDFAAQAQRNWHQWRGPNGDGSAPNSNLPAEFGEGKNVKWKVAVPGKGSSSPIVWEDRIYLMTAIEKPGAAEPAGPAAGDPELPTLGGGPPVGDVRAETIAGGERGPRGEASSNRRRNSPPRPGTAGLQTDGRVEATQERQERQERGGRGGRGGGRGGQAAAKPQEFVVLCLDRETGGELWRKVVAEGTPHEAGHGTNTFSAASPIVDGKRIYANFGSRGFFCLDMNGEILWQKDLGQMRTRNSFGEGSSASLYGNTVVIPWDHEGDSFIVALDATTGEEKWRVDRDEPTTWATPLITPLGDTVQVVTNGKRVRSYDLETGRLIWECGGQASNPIPSPVRYEDNVICMTGYQGYAIVSMALNSQGDITDSAEQVAWTGSGAAPYVPSPVLHQGVLYFVKSNNPLMVARDVKTGDVVVDETRLPKMRVVYASPVAAGDKIYFCSREGVVVVVKHGPTGEVLAVNDLGETIDASPAIVGDQMFLRTDSHLYCIEQE
jgi:outer membrane protein assembly factor BamB